MVLVLVRCDGLSCGFDFILCSDLRPFFLSREFCKPPFYVIAAVCSDASGRGGFPRRGALAPRWFEDWRAVNFCEVLESMREILEAMSQPSTEFSAHFS